jgi:prophage regulatory protein
MSVRPEVASPAPATLKCLRLAKVAEKLDCGQSTVWWKARTEPGFPQPIKLGGTTCWLEHELDAYIEKRIAESRGTAVPA